MKTKINFRNLVILSVVSALLLFVLNMVLFQNGYTVDRYQFIATGFLAIFVMDLFLISVELKIRLLSVGTLIVFATAIIEEITIVSLSAQDFTKNLSLFEIIYIIGLILSSFSFYTNVILYKKQVILINEQKKRLRIFSQKNKIIYFEYNRETKFIYLEFLAGFINQYQLPYQTLNVNIDEYLSYIHPDDNNLLKYNDTLIENTEIIEKVRIKYPGMSEYCHMYIRANITEDNKIIGMELDISTMQNLEDSLEEKNIELSQKEIDQKYILDNTSDFIAKISPVGEVLFMTKTYSDLFNLSLTDILGSHIYSLRPLVKEAGTNWLEATLIPPYSTSNTIQVNETWISWKNDAVLNELGEVDYIVTIGHDITKLINLNEQLKRDSLHDFLTGLLNRRGLFNELENLKIK